MVFAMYTSIAIAVISVLVSCRMIRRAQKQIVEMCDILTDIKNGNGNRRILSEPHEIAAPLTYTINEIVVSYENRLAAFRRTEEANKQLMTSLSHDVRTPLTTLIGYLDAAQKGIVSGKEKEDYLETARRKAYDLKEYIDVLFDWFRLNSDELTLSAEPVEAALLTKNILIDWVPIFEDKQMDYCIDIPEQPFPVKLDPDAYMRIINNLIKNAWEHGNADKIWIEVSVVEGCVQIKVRDNGKGISAEAIPYVFERLYQEEPSGSRSGGGLGLAIAKELVLLQNGNISVQSDRPHGTTFCVALPGASNEA